MKIAAAYDNGTVFQHFGHTEQFKIYDVADGAVASAEVIGTNGTGHEALAAFLKGLNVDVLICGGIGSGAQEALDAQGIEICAGAAGDADKAVAAYLRGELVDTGVNCDHHDEEHACGGCEDDEDCGAGCGGGCGGCHGGCHSMPMIEGKNAGKTCRCHYRGTFNDGTQFDSSYDRGEPLEFVCGAGMMIRGFDAAVADMDVGQTVQVHLMPSEAYGEVDPSAVFSVDIAELPGAESVSTGDRVYLQDMYGRQVPVRVIGKDEKTITFDANHEMAGKELNFTIELVEVLG